MVGSARGDNNPNKRVQARRWSRREDSRSIGTEEEEEEG